MILLHSLIIKAIAIEFLSSNPVALCSVLAALTPCFTPIYSFPRRNVQQHAKEIEDVDIPDRQPSVAATLRVQST